MSSIFGDIAEPTTAQKALFSAFEIQNVVKLPFEAYDSSDSFQNLTGMYKIITEADGSEYYLMWLEYETTFVSDGNYNPLDETDSNGDPVTNETEATWCNHSLEQ